MTERTITVEDLPAEFERLAAMATSPSHTNIWNSAADMLRAALSSDHQGGRGLPSGAREILEQLRGMLSEATVADVDIPAYWPSARCSNTGHEQRPEQHGEDDWRCPDCHSTWWAVDGSPPSAGSHIEARLFALLTDQPPAPRGLSEGDRERIKAAFLTAAAADDAWPPTLVAAEQWLDDALKAADQDGGS